MEFASASFQVVLDKVGSLVVKKIALICNVDDELRKLQRALWRVQAMLHHVENHVGFLHISHNEALKMWIQAVENFSYDADDMLDEISVSGKLNNDHAFFDDHKTNQVRSMILSSPKQLGIPNKIKKIKDALETVSEEMEGLSVFMPKLAKSGSLMVTAEPSNTYFCNASSFIGEDAIVGRGYEITKIINSILTPREIPGKISVLPIIGIGGIGKTTLAQIVYNDCRLIGKFHLRMWASVSSNFDVIKITRSIIESITETSCNLSSLHALQSKLQKLIAGKRLLLVLDDFWSEKQEDWDVLFSPLRGASDESKIIVTTRSEIVASITSKESPWYLQPLNDDDCWKLMKQKAFSYRNLEETVHLEGIGRQIAQKCKGLPLAAKTLGSVLHFKSNVQEWISLLETELWELREDKNDIFKSLALSYYHLPGYLKKCFAYCSIFPRNYEFQMDEMAFLWMAEGFIRPRGKTRLEDIGNEYFMDLAWRCFFQFSHILHLEGCAKHIYKMHDLVHDMAHLVSSNTCIRDEHYLSDSHHEFRHPRHMSLQIGSMQPISLKARNWYRKLRTFLVMCENNSAVVQVPYEIFPILKSVRVLNLSSTGIDELPGSIDCLKHLRYLNLSKNHIQKLPESITKLCALQTLKLKDCTRFLILPTDFKNLTDLRHLDLDVKHQLKCMPSSLGRLTNLQTLSAFILGRDKGCRIGELKNMQFLRGSICITNLDFVSSAAEAKEALVDNKPWLEKLELEWKQIYTNGDQQIDILESLKPHENVKTLAIKKYSASRFPDWLSDPLCKLRNICLQSCKNCSNLPSLGQLPFLKSLHIKDMPGTVSLDGQFRGHGTVTAFPMLEVLIFENMPKLIRWSELTDNDMPQLQELAIMDCQSLIGLPPLHSLNALKTLNIAECAKLQSLPEAGLPDSLQILIILKCPIIRERCRVGEGEDWDKIRRVRKIEIDYEHVDNGMAE